MWADHPDAPISEDHDVGLRAAHLWTDGQCGEKAQKRTSALPDHEIVLSFDVGSVAAHECYLETLDRHCVKATFFPVGEMALLGSRDFVESLCAVRPSAVTPG